MKLIFCQFIYLFLMSPVKDCNEGPEKNTSTYLVNIMKQKLNGQERTH